MSKLLKGVAVFTVLASLVTLSGVMKANAAVPSDYGLKEGDTISAAGSSDPDVYIVNDWGYKRLFLNPVIFNFYGHLGGFSKVKSVSAAARDAFPTSGLFRLDGDASGKVYGVESTGEDTGILHWVNTSGAQAVADDPNFFKKVFVINQNEFSWYSQGAAYTSVSQVPNYVRTPGATPTPVAGNVNVGLASDNPGAATLTTKANGVTFLRLNFSGTGTIANLRVVRHGPGKTTDLANVYIYDGARRLTSSRSLSSADGSATFTGLNVAVSGSKVLSVVADMNSSGATQGDVNYLSVDASSDVVLSSGTVGGTFPIVGSNMTVSGQAGGTLTIDKSGSLSNPNVGQTGVEMSEFKLTTATEGAKISRLQLLQGGTVKMSDITNLQLKVNDAVIATGSTTADGYVVFDLSSNPLLIVKGDNRIFKVYGNVAGKKAETINFYFEVTADSLAVGDQFGFGVTVTNNMGTSASAHTLTLQGGVLTLSFVGPTASNISTTTTKTHLLDFDMNAAANIELRKHTIVLCKDTGATGTYVAAADTTNGWGGILNVGIIDRDSGVMVVGPQDGTAFLTSNSSCPGGVAGAAKQFTDTFTMTAGQTKHLAVVGDIKTSNSTAGITITSGDAIKAIIDGYGDAIGTGGDLTILKYTGTNTALTKTDVVPSGDVSGNSQTIQGSSLTMALAAAPTGNNRYVKGTNDVTAVGFNLTTALGNPITVNTITLSGYVVDVSSASSGYELGAATGADSGMTVGGLISQIRLVDGSTGTVLATAPTVNNLTTTTGTVKFDSLNWVIPAGSTKTLLVKTDLSTNAVSGQSDAFSFDIAATTDITATDANSNTVNLASGNTAKNGGTAPNVIVSSFGVGTLTPAAAADTAASAAVYWGQASAPFSKFKFTSKNEGFYLERLNFYTADTAALLTNNIDKLHVTYTNKAGSTLTQDGVFGSAGSLSMSFADANRPYVPKDGILYVTVTGDIKTATQLWRASDVNFSVDFSGGNADEFRAVGEGSGAVIDGSDSNVVNVTSASSVPTNNQYVYRSYPQFTYLGTPATTIAVGQDVFKFKIDALGLASDGATVFFDGATGNTSGSMKFAVIASGTVNASNLGFDLRRIVDNNGLSVDQLVATSSGATAPQYLNNLAGAASGSTLGSASFRFQDVSANQSIEIPAGQSNTFVLRLNLTTGYSKPYNSNTGRAADFLQVIMKNNQNNLIYWTDKGGTTSERNSSAGSTSNILKNLPMNGTRINFN